MSLERTARDILVHDIKIIITIIGILTLVKFFIDQDVTDLYYGVAIILLIVFGTIAYYRFWADTIMTRVRKWR